MPLDRRAPFRQPGFQKDVQAIQRAAEEAEHGRGPYRVGWTRVRIDAPGGVPLAGYGDRKGAPSTGTRDPVYVRAFAVAAGDHRVVLLAADLLELDPTAAREVRSRLERRIEKDQIFFTASHTHSGPGAYVSGLIWEMVLGDYDERAFEAVVAAHVAAAEGALDDLSPGRIGSASLEVPGLIMNRTEKDGPVDDRLFVLRFEKANGETAAFWSYGCHAVTLPATNLLISADYPGEVAGAFEGRSLELLAFAAGGVGSANPKQERPNTEWLVGPLVAGLTRALAAAKVESRAEGTVASARVTRPTPPIRYRVDRDLAVWGALIQPLIGVDHVSYGAIVLDDTVLLHVPAEPSGELTRAARERARERGVELAVLPFNGTYIGYVTPRRVYDLPEEKGEELLHYETHVMTFLGPWGGDLIMNLGLRLASGLRAAARLREEPGFF